MIALSDKNRGTLEAEEVVKVAEAKDHDLHAEFEWDNKVAGHQHRLSQARNLIAVVRVEHSPEELLRPRQVPVFVKNPHATGYLTIIRARESADISRAAAVAEFGKAAQALRRARIIAEQLGIPQHEIDQTIAKLVGFQMIVAGGSGAPH